MSNSSTKFAKRSQEYEELAFQIFQCPSFQKGLPWWLDGKASASNAAARVKCVLQNLPELDVCGFFIPTVLLGTESFTLTAGWIGLETSWLINNVHMIQSTVHNSR